MTARFSYNCLQGVIGKVYKVLHGKAGVDFEFNSLTHKAILFKEYFYHKTQPLDQHKSLKKYLRKDDVVKFACRRLDQKINEIEWVIFISWVPSRNPFTSLQLVPGLYGVAGLIVSFNGKYGCIKTVDSKCNDIYIRFKLTDFYIGLRVVSDPMQIMEQINLTKTVFFDALPTIAEENEDNCSFLATFVYTNKRPRISKLRFTPVANTDDYCYITFLAQSCRHQYQTLFMLGKGFIAEIMSDDYGTIVGEFNETLCRPIIFHRNSLKGKKCVSLFDTISIGDIVKFVAFGLAKNMYADFIAVDVYLQGLSKAITV